MNLVSLFSGVGGFELGFEKAGFKTVFQCEVDGNAAGVLMRHWPDVPKWIDVTTLSGSTVVGVCAEPDCVVFGSPCQDLSVAGRRAGISGSRSSLFYEAIRVVKEIREVTNGEYPKWVVWENVAGALSSNRGDDFGAVLDEMAGAGAVGIEWAVLDAQYFGVPQRRRRVFVVAGFDSVEWGFRANPLFPVSESVRGNSKKGQKKKKNAATKIAAGLRNGGSGGVPSSRGEHLVVDSETPNPEKQLTFTSMNFGGWDETEVAGTLSQRDYKDGRTITIGSGKDVVNTISASLYHHGTVVNQDANNGHVVVESEVAPIGFSHTQGLSAQPSEKAWPTLRVGGNGHAVLNKTMKVRKLTPVECERLMGWPDDHTRWHKSGKEQSDSSRYKQCGNGVAAPVAEWVADKIINKVFF
jgi:DNA (cytosine-5)-methyltransferase 1